MKIGTVTVGPLAIGAALIVGFLLFGRKTISSDEALVMVQEVVKSPEWRSLGLTNRPFSEYHAWEVEETEDGAFLVTARHYLVGPTRFHVDADGVNRIR
jgi:hypothetical protein